MEQKKFKAVFFDIDGTLLSFKTHQVPKSTELAIFKLKEQGVKVILSTGRSINSIDHVKYLDFDGFITFNGGYCVTKEGDILRRSVMDREDLQRLIDFASATPMSFAFMSDKDILIHDISKDISGMYQSLNLPVPPSLSFDDVDLDSVLQTNVFIDPEKEKQFMHEIMPNSTASRWTDLFADVNPKGQSKKVGIDIFCEHFGIHLSETMAFGDGGNDIEMLKHVEMGIAMGNANENVKIIADYITDDVDSDGISNALRQLGMI